MKFHLHEYEVPDDIVEGQYYLQSKQKVFLLLKSRSSTEADVGCGYMVADIRKRDF